MDYKKEEIREKFKDLFEHSLDLIYVNDLNGNFLDANEITLITLGYERDEIPNVSFIDLLDKENLMKAYRVTKEIKKSGKQSKKSEYKIKTKDGNFLYIETYGIPLKKDGNIYAVLGIGKNVTDRKKAEQNLKKSGEMFKAIYKEGPIPAYTWQKYDDDFVLIDFNNAAAKITNGTVNDFLGYKASELYKDREDILEDLTLCMSEKFQITREMKYKFHFSGEEKFLLVNYGYVSPDLIIVHTEDITERKRAEENLIESEKKYRNLIENLDVGFYQVKLDGEMLNHNSAHNVILGYDPSESLIGKNVSEFWQNPEDRGKYLEFLAKEGMVRGYICHAKTKTGRNITLELNSHLIRDKDGWPIQIDGTITDVTEKFNLERKLRESEAKFRNLYENIPFSIVLLDSKGVIIDINPRSAEVFGYKKGELIGKKFKDVSVLHPNYLPRIIELFKKFIKGEIVHRIDLQAYKKNGSLIWVNLQAGLIDIAGETHVQAIFNDITPQKEAEILIKEEIKKLKELDTIRKNLISRVSHELKTPLVSISGGSELLLTLYKDKFGAEQLEIIELIEKGGKRLRHLVDNLIDISRVEYNKLQLSKKPRNLSKVIKDCVKELDYWIKERKLNLTISAPKILELKIDQIRIEQVIINLLSNAIKNTPPDGEIGVNLNKKGNWAEFRISDTGIGLTNEEMYMLFTRFGKIERYGPGYEYVDIQGTGLGLFISKEIIDLHEGEIRAESAGRNKGSTFIVKLPIN
ncbi:MAG: PAS domain S-box protein [Candidatus Hermodarchaeota archaeon]